ncbi:hypothetical protein LINPERHAP2_LOCUS33678 [Linum perenne]
MNMAASKPLCIFLSLFIAVSFSNIESTMAARKFLQLPKFPTLPPLPPLPKPTLPLPPLPKPTLPLPPLPSNLPKIPTIPITIPVLTPASPTHN